VKNPFQVVRDFEAALCEYTGAPYAVTTTSCTMALLLAVGWQLHGQHGRSTVRVKPGGLGDEVPEVEIPRRTYVGVPMSIIHAGGQPTFRDEEWVGAYQLKPLEVFDSARLFTSGMCVGARNGFMDCVSFHWSKTLGIQQGGAILHDNPQADAWLRRARFDGREEGVAPKDQKDWQLGWHAYLSPEIAAEGLVRLANLPKNNEPLPWGPGTSSDYPDLSTMDIFK